MPFLLVFFVALPLFARDMIVHTSLLHEINDGEANSEIFLMDVKTKKSQRLTTNKFMDYEPTLHPSGKLVAYISNRWKYDLWGEEQIVLHDLVSKKEEHLNIGMHMWAHRPRFSADGKYLYFSRASAPRPETAMSSYSIMRYELATGEMTPVLPYVRGNFFDVVPSPDGKMLAYRYAADGDQHVRILDLATKEQRPLSVRPERLPEEEPAWKSNTELTIVAHYGEHDELQRSLFSVPLAERPGTQILRSPLVYDYHSACWFDANNGVISAADTATGTVQLFLVQKEKLTKISSSEFWWSSEADCRRY